MSLKHALWNRAIINYDLTWIHSCVRFACVPSWTHRALFPFQLRERLLFREELWNSISSVPAAVWNYMLCFVCGQVTFTKNVTILEFEEGHYTTKLRGLLSWIQNHLVSVVVSRDPKQSMCQYSCQRQVIAVELCRNRSKVGGVAGFYQLLGIY